MTTYNTGNPIGSTDPRDLYDNAENLDKFANGTWLTYPDRLGASRKSLAGMEVDFVAAQADKESRFAAFLNSSGYQSLGNYGAGILITAHNQYVMYAGQPYRLAAAVAVPYTTTGTWAGESSNFVLVGDAALRQELGNADSPALGAEMVGFSGQSVRTALNSVRSRTLYALDPQWGFVNSTDADNTAAAVAILDAAQDGDTVDFCGVMWRVYAGVNGALSATADPAVTKAVPLSSVPRLVNKRDITLRNGGLYAAFQGVSPDKRYYPSTLYIKGCTGIVFGPGSRFESRGENFGDADASEPLSYSDRQDFLAVNGGHAVVMVRSSRISGSLEARLCGSCAVVYAASCYEVRLSGSFANAASLGYAAFAADAWCGGTAESGFPEHSLYLDNCQSFAESLTRREDSAAVGSAVYSTKGSVTGEDPSVLIYVRGGAYGDCYGNGGAEGEFLGHAFSANSSYTEVSGSRVFNVAYAGGTLNGADVVSRLVMRGVTGTVGAAVYIAYPRSFGQQEAEITDCSIAVDGSRLLGAITETAYVINKVGNSPCRVTLRDCKFSGAKQVAWRPSGAISYGWLDVDGGHYETNGYLAQISGWGSPSASSYKGVTIRGDAIIEDVSALTDAYVDVKNVDGSTLCFLFFDARRCTIRTAAPRDINGVTNCGSASLEERIWLPENLERAYSTRSPGYPMGHQVTYIGDTGVIGPDLRIILQCDSGYPVGLPSALVGAGGVYVGLSLQVSAPALHVGTGKLRHEVLCRGTFSEGSDLVVGGQYKLIG